MLGLLMARLLSGVVARYIGWRYVYWISFGLQYGILILLWLFMPDYPATNPTPTWKALLYRYPSLLLDIIKIFFRHPVIVQSCLLAFLASSVFNSFWTTLTFLLSSPPYSYNSLTIGLFALVGIAALFWGPFFARTFVDTHHPLLSVIIGELAILVAVIVGTATGKVTIAGPVIQALLTDLGVQTSQIANRTAIYGVEPKGRNRVNTAFMVCAFSGQLTGTAAGNKLYDQGGWIRSGSASIGFVSLSLVVCGIRGPHEPGWIGWKGGWNMGKNPVKKTERESQDVSRSGSGDLEQQNSTTNHDVGIASTQTGSQKQIYATTEKTSSDSASTRI
jgi:predicted MFS family arabinose efflux permease